MTVRKRLARSNICMFLVPLLIAALLLLLGGGIALYILETTYLPRRTRRAGEGEPRPEAPPGRKLRAYRRPAAHPDRLGRGLPFMYYLTFRYTEFNLLSHNGYDPVREQFLYYLYTEDIKMKDLAMKLNYSKTFKRILVLFILLADATAVAIPLSLSQQISDAAALKQQYALAEQADQAAADDAGAF